MQCMDIVPMSLTAEEADILLCASTQVNPHLCLCINALKPEEPQVC